jgi:hypothetical protein
MVSATALTTIDQVLAALRTKHLQGNDLKLAPVCTRVMLRTGVNLRSPRPEQVTDAGVIAKVRSCLTEMGYPL